MMIGQKQKKVYIIKSKVETKSVVAFEVTSFGENKNVERLQGRVEKGHLIPNRRIGSGFKKETSWFAYIPTSSWRLCVSGLRKLAGAT